MDIHKGAAWANIGSFAVGCAALYLLWNSGRPQTAENGTAQSATSFHPLMWIFLIVLFLAGLLHLIAALVDRRAHVPGSVQASPPSAQGPPSNILSNPKGFDTQKTALPKGFDTQTVLPDGRAIINCTLEDLRGAFREYTIDQFNRMLQGKWIKMSGKLEENHGKGEVYLAGNSPLVILHFGKGWEEQLSSLRRGSDVTIRGMLSEGHSGFVRFRECELL